MHSSLPAGAATAVAQRSQGGKQAQSIPLVKCSQMKRPSMNACAAVRNSTSVHRVCAAVELEPTRSNAQEQEEEEPANIAYGCMFQLPTAGLGSQKAHFDPSRSGIVLCENKFPIACWMPWVTLATVVALATGAPPSAAVFAAAPCGRPFELGGPWGRPKPARTAAESAGRAVS